MNNSDELKNIFELRSGITIFSSQDQAIDNIITSLVEKIPAKFILVTAVTGQVVSAAGDRNRINLVALGSLIAGDLAASQEIARMTGEYQESQMVLREGDQSHIFIAEAGEHLILFVQISSDVALGWARLLIQDAAKKIAQIIESHPEDVETFELEENSLELPDLFSNALDQLWNGEG